MSRVSSSSSTQRTRLADMGSSFLIRRGEVTNRLDVPGGTVLYKRRVVRATTHISDKIDTNEGRRLAEQAVVLVLDHLVALADCCFQTVPVEYPYAAAHVADE